MSLSQSNKTKKTIKEILQERNKSLLIANLSLYIKEPKHPLENS